MAKAGVVFGEEGEAEAASSEPSAESDERLAVFRDFVNSLDLDDLDKPKDE
jgi:hypothetical protein